MIGNLKIKNNPDFKALLEIPDRFPKAEVFLVGGIVRDLLIKRKSEDYDFMVTGVALGPLAKYLQEKGQVNLVGKNFGVLKFRPKNSVLTFDLSLPRTEFSTKDGSRRDFSVQYDPALSVEEDLQRRDFTINAMAFNIRTKKLIDPFNGQQDLKKRLIRAVGKPKERFREDYSRILRAIRFACQLNMEIEKNTWAELKKLVANVFASEMVPQEIIGTEFLKSFDANPAKWWVLAESARIMPLLFPELEQCKGIEQDEDWHGEGDVYEHTKLIVSKLTPQTPLSLKLACMFHDLGKALTIKTPEKDGTDRISYYEHTEVSGDLIKAIARRWRWDGKLRDQVAWLAIHHHLFSSGDIYQMRPSTIYKYFVAEPEQGNWLLELYRLDTLASLYVNQKKDLKKQQAIASYVNEMRAAFARSKTQSIKHLINGEDIIKYFSLEAGPQVGERLDQAEEYVLRYVTKYRQEPEKDKILKYLESVKRVNSK